MNIAVITTVFNEPIFLPLWMKYYGTLFGEDNLYIVDNDSTDGCTNNIGRASRIRMPRHFFDEYDRSQMISKLHGSLLKFYDFILFADTDEFLMVYPGGVSLRTYIETLDYPYATAIGIDVVQVMEEEMDMDWTKPIMKQRNYGIFNSGMCKTLISSIPIDWSAGLHGSQLFPHIDFKLYMLHLRRADYKTESGRLDLSRKTPWKRPEFATAHHLISPEELLARYRHFSKKGRVETEELDLSSEIQQFLSGQKYAHGRYWHLPHFVGTSLIRIPAELRAML